MVVVIYFKDEAHLLPDGVEECWVLDHVTDARPYALYFVRDNHLRGNSLTDMEYNPHAVVELDPNGSICWYDMLEFECEDYWAIDPEWEDFDYEDEDDEDWDREWGDFSW